MTEQNPPYCLEAEAIKHPAQLFRQAIGTLLAPAGGVAAADSLEVKQRGAGANMSVDVNGGVPPLGQAWVPGTSVDGTQGLYYCWNNGVVNKGIAASSESAPRVDTVVARVRDEQYAGAENKWELEVLEGTPEAGATLENQKGAATVPASCLVLAYVLVSAKATEIKTVDIGNVATTFTTRPALNVVQHTADATANPGELLEMTATGTVTIPLLPTNSLVGVYAGDGPVTIKSATNIYGGFIDNVEEITLEEYQTVVLLSMVGGSLLIIGGEPKRESKYSALTSRAAATPFTPNTARPTFVSLVIGLNGGEPSEAKIKVGGVQIASVGDDTTLPAGVPHFPFSFICPAGVAWEWENNGAESVESSYLTL